MGLRSTCNPTSTPTHWRPVLSIAADRGADGAHLRTGEGIGHQRQVVGFDRRAGLDGDEVEPPHRRVEQRHGRPQRRFLVVGEVQFRTRAGLDLDDDRLLSVPDDQVELGTANPEVGNKHDAAIALQVVSGDRLADST